MKNELIWIYVTCATKREATQIGRALVEERLAACVNVFGPIRSIYRWQGKIHQGTEVALAAKTQRRLLKKLTSRVCALHSYDCPCVVALPIKGGNPDFLKWIADETSE